MKTNWALVAGIVAVLSVPFALAMLEDSSKKEPGSDRAEPAPPAPEEAAEPAPPPEQEPAAAWKEVRAMDLDFFNAVFFSGEATDGPALSGPLAGLRFGADSEAVKKDAPELAQWVEHGWARFPQASASITVGAGDGNGLGWITISFPDDGTARRLLASRWGAPEKFRSEYRDLVRYAWMSPERGVRLLLREGDGLANVDVSDYIPLERLLAGGKKHTFGFERVPLLGATRDQIKHAYADEMVAHDLGDGVLIFELPPTKLSAYRTSVQLNLENDRVQSFQFSIAFDLDPSLDGGALDLLEEVAGSPREVGDHLELSDYGRRVVLDVSGEAVDVTVSPL